jgi:lysylphosphatidylglycerol synthetase-like protein (DUF2156 family)
MISSAAALLLMLCFFLPWVTVSCSGQPVATVSGQDLASGMTVEAFGSSEHLEGETVLYLVPLAGVIALGLALIGGRVGKGLSIAQIILAVLVSLLLFLTWNNMQSQIRQYNLDVSLKIGFLGSILAVLGIIAGAVLSMSDTSPPKSFEGAYDDIESSWDDW